MSIHVETRPSDLIVHHQRSADGSLCACGCSGRVPELDARSLPKAVRHGAVLGAVIALERGAELLLVAPHDPLSLLAKIDKIPGSFGYEYVERAPGAVTVRIARH